MNILAASFVVVCFAGIAHIIGLLHRTTEVIVVSKKSIMILRNATLDDHAKEKALQQHALKLFQLFGLLLFGSSLSLAIPFGLIWIGDFAGLISLKAVIDILMCWEFLVGVTIVGFGAHFFSRCYR